MRLSRVAQEDESGCGIACVAIVANLSYPQTKELFLEEVFLKKRRQFRTYQKELEKALRLLEIGYQRRKFRSWIDFNGVAIVPIKRDREGRHFHWVVAERSGSKIRIIDPDQLSVYRFVCFGRPKVKGYYIQIETIC